jgi:hypothetical protein
MSSAADRGTWKPGDLERVPAGTKSKALPTQYFQFVRDGRPGALMRRRHGHIDEAEWDGEWHRVDWLVEWNFNPDPNRELERLTPEEAQKRASVLGVSLDD